MVGASDLSASLTVLAASAPDPVSSLANDPSGTSGQQIKVTWFAPYNGGSPILQYYLTYIDASQKQPKPATLTVDATIISTKLESLTIGKTYSISIQAINSVGSSDPVFIQVLAAQVPGAPTSFSIDAAQTTQTSITLQWKDPNDTGGSPITEYYIYQEGKKIVSVSFNLQSYTVGGLNSNTQYSFQVATVNIYGVSFLTETKSEKTLSQIVIATTAIPKQPNPPSTVFNIGADGSDTVTISWLAPSSTDTVTGYVIKVRQNDQTTYALTKNSCKSLLTNTRSCIIPVSELQADPFRLVYGDDVYAIVAAQNGELLSDFSRAGNGGKIITKSTAPANLVEEIRDRTLSTLGISWDPPVFNGRSQIIGYKIEKKKVGDSSSTLVDPNFQKTSYTFTGLVLGQNYEFKVTAINDYGLSDPNLIILLCAFKPSLPLNVQTINSEDKVIISWSAPSSDGGSQIIGYKVYFKQHSGQTYSHLPACDVDTRQCIISIQKLWAQPFNLIKGDTILTEVMAYNIFGNSELSAPGGQAKVYFIPEAPLNLVNDYLNTDQTKITLIWDQNPQNGDSTVLNFDLYWGQCSHNQAVCPYQLLDEKVQAPYTTTRTLNPGTEYSFYLIARNLVGQSSPSNAVYVLAASVPQPVVNLRNLLASFSTEVKLDWDSPNTNGGSPITFYQIQYADASLVNSKYQTISVPAISTFATINQLNQGTNYNFSVKAINAVGSSDISSILVKAAYLPGVPVQFKNVDILENQITIAWQNPQDDGGSQIIGFNIWSDLLQAGTLAITQSVESSQLSYTFENLLPGRTYLFAAQAFNEIGPGDLTKTISATTFGFTPDKPDAPKLQLFQDYVELVWAAPKHNSAPITGYLIEIISKSGVLVGDVIGCQKQFSTITSCNIAVSVLRDQLQLSWGDPVQARVTAFNNLGKSQASVLSGSVILITVPDKPILKEDPTQRSLTTLGLSWTLGASNGGSGVISCRVSLIGNGQTTIISSNIKDQDYTVSGLNPGITYQFIVECRNELGYSDQSNTLQLIDAYFPSTPQSVSTSNFLDEVVVSWDAPVSNGAELTEVKVFIQGHSGNDYFQVSCLNSDDDITRFSYCKIHFQTLKQTPYFLQPGDKVQAKVQLSNKYGDSSLSKSGTEAFIYGLPDAPINFRNDPSITTDFKIGLLWDLCENGGAPVCYYDIYFSDNSLISSEIMSTSYTLTSVTAGQTYCFKIYAKTVIGQSQSFASVCILAADVPDEPFGLQSILAETKEDQISILWSVPYNHGSVITHYIVSYQSSKNQQLKFVENNVQGNKAIINGLNQGQTYLIFVQAVNSVGLSKQSSSIAVLVAQIPDVVEFTKVDASLKTDQQVSISWKALQKDGGSQIMYYTVYWYTGSPRTLQVLFLQVTDLSALVDGLAPQTAYEFKITATNAIGESQFSESLIVSTLNSPVPPPPNDLPKRPSAPSSVLDGDFITVSWDAADGQRSIITGYNLQIRTSDQTYINEAHCNMISSTLLSCKIPVSVLIDPAQPFKLNYGDNLYARLAAISSVGQSDFSQVAKGAQILKKPDPPLIYEDFSSRTKNTITLKWDYSAITGGSPIKDVQIMYAAAGGDFQTINSGNSAVQKQTFKVENLIEGTDYQFKIQVSNDFGFSEYSNTIATTVSFTPDPPQHVKTEQFEGKILIQWDASYLSGDYQIDYIVLIKGHKGNNDYHQVKCDDTDTKKLFCFIDFQTLLETPFNLDSGDQIVAKIQAQNKFGLSELSEEGKGAKLLKPPDAPINLGFDRLLTNDQQISIFWDQVEQLDAPVLQWKVYFDDANGLPNIFLGSVESRVFTTKSVLISGQVYTFIVTASNQIGQSKQSEKLRVLAAREPDRIQDLQGILQETKAGEIVLKWSAPYCGGAKVTHYVVTYTKNTQINLSQELRLQSQAGNTEIVSDTSARLKNLQVGYGYTITVIAQNEIGQSPPSDAIEIVAASLPQKVTGLRNDIAQTTQTKIRVFWDSPVYTGLSHVFEVYLSEDKGEFEKLATVLDITSYTLQDLLPDTNYKVKVRETNQVGVGLSSDTLVVATLARPLNYTLCNNFGPTLNMFKNTLQKNKAQGGNGDGDTSNNNDDSCCGDLPTTFTCNPDILSIYDVPTPYCPQLTNSGISMGIGFLVATEGCIEVQQHFSCCPSCQN